MTVTKEVDDDLIKNTGNLSLDSTTEKDTDNVEPQESDEPFVVKRYNERQQWSTDVLSRTLSRSEREEDWISGDHPYFDKVESLCRRKKFFEDNRWKSNIKLASGNRRFPVILLQNPTGTHEQPYEEMVENTPTLKFLREKLEDIGLSLEDVPIIDVFPLFTDQELKSLETRQQAFDLTLEFLDTFEITNIVSLQCTTSYPEYFPYPDGWKLGSSVEGAQALRVRKELIRDRQINIVQGFHPSYIFRQEDAEETLTEVLRDAYGPCAEWKRKQEMEAVEQIEAGVETSVQKCKELTAEIRALRGALRKASRLFPEKEFDSVRDISSVLERFQGQIEQMQLRLETIS